MMKRKVKVMLGLMVIAVIPVLVLMQFSRSEYYRQDGVERKFCCMLAREEVISLPAGSWYLAGARSRGIFLGSRSVPSQVLIVNYADGGHVGHRDISSDQYNFREPTRITIDSPFIFVAGLRSGMLLKGDLTSFSVVPIAGHPFFLAEAVPMGGHGFAIRTVGDKTNELVLGKRMNDPPYLRKVPGLLEKQIDGIFCTDGMLRYSGADYLVYVYYYRNEFICMDTSLNLVYRGHTIDTISRAAISVAYFESTDTKIQTRPPVMVNVRSFASRQWLFIQSRMMASNEDADVFEASSVIDVYNLIEGRYAFSFYVPDLDGEGVKDFFVSGHTIIVLYGERLAVYGLDATALNSRRE